MWFMNKIINPLVMLILRSPLHALLSAAVLLITCSGRKTGRTYCLPVQYAQEGNSIYIVPGMPEKKTWWRNLKEDSPVQLSLRGRDVAGTGRLLRPDTDSAEILTGFGAYLRRFPSLIKYHHIRTETDGSFNTEDLRRAAMLAVVLRVEMQK